MTRSLRNGKVRQRPASLWFVEEEINDDDCRAEWQLLGKIWQGGCKISGNSGGTAITAKWSVR
ncbi:hypothetical protein AB8404_004145 [Salmonella enterica]